MNDPFHSELAGWSNFYLVTASAAAALTGLQFIVQTLMTPESFRRFSGGDPESGIAAFATPTVVHFSVAMMVSAILCAPWPGYAGLQATIGAIMAGALVYQAIVFRRTRRQKVYATTAYDWVWYVSFPAVAYAFILAAAVAGPFAAPWPPFLCAAGVLVLLGVGIHNSWDSVTYMTIVSLRSGRREEAAAAEAASEAASQDGE